MKGVSGKFVFAAALLLLFVTGEIVFRAADSPGRSCAGIVAHSVADAGNQHPDQAAVFSLRNAPDLKRFRLLFELTVLTIALFIFSYTIFQPVVHTVLYLPMKIRTKLTLSGILILMLSDFAFITYNFIAQRNLAVHSMANQVSVLHRFLESESLWDGTGTGVDAKLEDAIRVNKNSLRLDNYELTSVDVVDAAVLGTNFQLLGYYGRAADFGGFLGQGAGKLIERARGDAAKNGALSEPIFGLSSISGGRLLNRLVGDDTVLMPVYRNAALSGYYLIRFDIRPMSLMFFRNVSFNFVLFAVLMTLLVLLIHEIGDSMAENIGLLIDWTKQINNGNFDVEKSVPTSDELETLARNFDKMRIEMGDDVRHLRLLSNMTLGMQNILEPDKLYLYFLTYMTANFGFCYNRAAFFLIEGKKLKGSYAVGLLDENEVVQRFGTMDSYRAFRIDLDLFQKEFEEVILSHESRFVREVKRIRIGRDEPSVFWNVIDRDAPLYIGRKFEGLEGTDRRTAERLYTSEFVLLPFKLKNETAGVLLLDNPFSKKPFGEKDIQQVRIALNDFSANVERAILFSSMEKLVEERTGELNRTLDELTRKDRMMKMDLTIARRIQLHLLPKGYENRKDLAFHVSYQPMGDVGGDFYDVAEVAPSLVRVLLADATGHGVQAALITTLIKSEYEKYKSLIRYPGELIEQLNASYIANYQYLSYFFTCIVVDFDLAAGKLRYASGGHPTQYLIRGGAMNELAPSGKIVGIIEDAVFETRELELCKDDRLLLFTDGLFEQMNSKMEEFSEARMYEEACTIADRPIDEIIGILIGKVDAHRGSVARTDDVTIAGIRYLGND